MRTFSVGRAAVVLVLMLLAFVSLGARVAYLQTYGREQTVSRAERQQHQNSPLYQRRGTIQDRNGLVLAGTVQSMTIFIDPKFMIQQYQTDGRTLVDMDSDVEKLAGLLDQDVFELSTLISERANDRFVKIAEHIDETTCEAINQMKMPGLGVQPTSERYYPMGSIAAHVLGGTGKDGNGLEGLELKFNSLLRGKDGFMRVLKDARRRAIAVSDEDYVPPEHGQHLVLTIDANIQMIAEQELMARCELYKAPRGEVVVMDPRNGDILALANYPAFNPQALAESPTEVRLNRAVVVPYEPGSTFKPFIAGPALSQRLTRVGEVFPTGGKTWITPYGRRITDVHGYDQLSLWDVLVKSSNIGMCMLAQRMGNTRIYEAIRGFGFGQPTGVELPGEDPGVIHPLRKWGKFSTDSVAQGYEVMVTPLQLARAFCAYANGGRLVEPRVIKGVLDAAGEVVARQAEVDLKLLPQAIDPMTAADMKRVLSDVPVRGTARGNRSKTWNLFGKTGTAHISQGLGGYAEDKYTSSFMGAGPAESPRLVCVMIIHEPNKKWALQNNMLYYGGAVAAPGAIRVLDRSLAYLQVPASPGLPPPPPKIAALLYDFKRDEKQYGKPPSELAKPTTRPASSTNTSGNAASGNRTTSRSNANRPSRSAATR